MPNDISLLESLGIAFYEALFIIVLVIIVGSVPLEIIVFIIYYMNAKSEKREITQSLIVKSSSTETSVQSLSATKSFEPKSSQDYSKQIDLQLHF